jgi:serine/threonine protein kinase/tetratricopeptide (TPR) repeat protein
MTLSPGTRLGRYEIVAPLGAGGMGEVYRARDGRLDRDVAVKVLPDRVAADSGALARFEREAKAVAALSHPNIVAIHDVGREGSTSYAVMELLDGATLREHLAAETIGPRQAVQYALEIARGLAAAHEKGIVHRDLKPENVFVTPAGHVKILDFGLARVSERHRAPDVSQAATATGGTEPGTILGTISYMSPEQVRARPVDHRSDIFSFGLVFFEMLVGHRAFRADSDVETMNAILSEEPSFSEPGRSVPAGLERIVRRCLEKDPARRFQNAGDLGFAIEAVSGLTAAESAPLPAAEPSSGKRSVAVLLFKDLGRSPENAHLALGLADATITELATVRSLLVRPTAAILRYQDRSVDPQQAGRELGVEAVVDGSFQRSGSRLRVTVQLLSTTDGRPLWASKIDSSLDDIFEMQDHVSRKIAEALQVELTPSEERRLARAARPVGRAYELYLKGRSLLFRETLEACNAAIEAFEQARDVDPQFALAWAGLSAAYARMELAFEPERDWLDRAEAMCEKALSIDPSLPEGRYLRGEFLWSPRYRFDHAGAIREILAAIAGRPSLAEAHDRLSVVLGHVSMFDEAIQHSKQALAIDPEDAVAETHLGLAYFHAGRYDDALRRTESATSRSPGAWALHQLIDCQIRLGRLSEAADAVEGISRQFPNDVLFFPIRGMIAALERDAPRARRHMELSIQNKKAFRHYHHAQYDIACIHALLGEREEALRWLSDAAHNGFPCHGFFETDPFLESLRGEARFGELLKELRQETAGYRRLYEELRGSAGGSAESVV